MVESLGFPAQRNRTADDLVERLIHLILESGLKPGDRLPSERQLMAQLSVGRSSLREAVKALSAMGVLEVSVGSGTFVGNGSRAILTKPLSWMLLMGEQDCRDLIEARRVIEGELASLAAERATDEELAAIGERLALLRVSTENAEAFTRYDLEFHLAIARAAHNQVLAQVVDTLRHILKAWFIEVYSRVENKELFIAQHEPIYEALRARDPERARRAMVEHMDHGLKWLLDSQRQSRDGEKLTQPAKASEPDAAGAR